MFFKQIFNEKIAQHSYLVACQKTKDAIIIDPIRILDEYEATAKKEGFNITKVTETHIHADFASGIRNVCKKFNATAYVSDEGDENWKYENMPPLTRYVKDGDSIHVGNIELKVIHTPGHTPESISFLLVDHGGCSEVPMGMFTGDFLFVGDVGRPDLLEEATKMVGTKRQGAKEMFQSLKKLNDYPDYLQIWPGHGAGSPCGKALGAVPFSTLGYEKHNNWALQIEDEATFIEEILKDQPEPPNYFAQIKKINKEGMPHFHSYKVSTGVTEELSGDILDTRPKEAFKQNFYKGSINVPYNKKFLQFVGWYLKYDRPLTVILNLNNAEDIKRDLALIGFDQISRFISEEEAEKYFNQNYENISPKQFNTNYHLKNVLDVRTKKERADGHISHSHHIHFGHLNDVKIPFNKNEEIYVHCQSGVRSAIATSVLIKNGFTNVKNVEFGYIGIQQDDRETK